MCVDPVTQLGLNTDSVMGYSIGDIHRSSDADTPELLPCGYLVGESDTISVKLKGTCKKPVFLMAVCLLLDLFSMVLKSKRIDYH